MKLYLPLFFTLSLSANDVFLPKKRVNLSKVPGYISDLVENTNKKKEQQKLKEFGQTVEEIVKSSDEELEKKADDLIKNKKELDKFLISAKNNKKFSKKYLNDIEIEKLLALQYQDASLLNNKISLKVKNADIKDVIELISKSANLDFIIDSSVVGNIGNINFKNIPISNALKIILSSNNPKLALINDHGVFRIMNKKDALPILKIHKTKIRQNALISEHVTIFNAKWTETLKLRIEKMWYGIISSADNTKGYYLVFDDATKKIFIKGEKQEVLELKKYLKLIDNRIPQIRIDTRVVIAAKDFEESFGFQLSGVYNRSSSISNDWNFAGAGPISTGSSGDFPAGTLNNWALNLLPDTASKFLNFPVIFGGRNLDSKRLNLVLNAAENKSQIETILKPTLLVNSNELAEILVGQEVPIETSVQESIQNTLRNVNTINYKDLGMKLRVKPTVQPDKKTVFLDIYVEHSYIKDYSSHSFDSKTSVITITKSKNRVILNSGQTTLIGGLISNEKRKTKNGIPILQNIPVIGWLFSGRRKIKTDDQLMIFITPTII